MVKDTQITKAKILSAFLKFYEKKGIEKITIGEIAKEAKIYRGTFYYYYEDIYDLLAKIQAQIFEEVIGIISKMVEGFMNGNLEEITVTINRLFENHEEMMTLFLIKKPDVTLQRKIKECGKRVALNKLGIEENQLSIEQKYLLEYIASAQLGLITRWIENKKDITPDQLAKIIEMANLRGPLTSIKQLARI